MPHDTLHDDGPTLTPAHPGLAGAFDRLVETNLEMIIQMKEVIISNNRLASAVEQLVIKLSEPK